MRTVRLHCHAPRLGAAFGVMLLAVVACGTRGNGEPGRETRELGELQGIDVGGVFVLKAERANDRLVEIEGDANLLPHVQLTVDGGVLHARTDTNVSPQLDLVLHVRSPEIREIELSGAARGEITGIAGDSFELEVSGASDAKVAGEVERFELEVSGASDVDAAALVARDVKVEVDGASEASVTANVSLSAEASGASEIVWGGDATQISREATGASSIERRP